jgi:purine-binding chemotaxis protein CheW
VREFTDIDKIVPIPCCPSYILGNLNLRGEIVTLVDLRHLLNLPLTDWGSNLKAMVVHLEDLVVGVAIEQVCDVTYVHSSQVMPVPAAIHSSKDEYLRGTVAYRDRMMSLLDLAKILTDGCLVVDEEP